MAQLTVAIILPAAGVPRQLRLKVGETMALLDADNATKLGTQLIELAAIARSQDAAADEPRVLIGGPC